MGFVFIPVFLGILYCNSQMREVRDDESRTFAAFEQAQSEASRLRAPPEDATAEDKAAFATQQAESDATRKRLEADYRQAKGVRDRWRDFAGFAGWLWA